ncbi:MAG: DUF2917 domain-containing protein [Hyphomicrobiaceae bacterium]|nr:MAG: DUF2917 domain-containing protein [Hyphomicrobiaceae bacterium]
MNQSPDIERIIVRARSVTRIEEGEGVAVTCCKGAIWITQANDARDVVLEAGESFVLDRPGLALVFAIADSAVILGPGWRIPAGASVPVPAEPERLCA